MFNCKSQEIRFLSSGLKFRVGHDCLIREDAETFVQFEPKKTALFCFASHGLITEVRRESLLQFHRRRRRERTVSCKHGIRCGTLLPQNSACPTWTVSFRREFSLSATFPSPRVLLPSIWFQPNFSKIPFLTRDLSLSCHESNQQYFNVIQLLSSSLLFNSFSKPLPKSPTAHAKPSSQSLL
ncbi:hypothetical protein MRB53_011087 [Persea americana]|uniref:Uncharacterized protein n=1 Tax=Persea americana TaxID=3435 RepID=A0ACC2LTU6_PERAE|nr:hypothetical protein MRB53_011087 [Persea americana]